MTPLDTQPSWTTREPLGRAWRDDLDSATNAWVRRWMPHFGVFRDACVESWVEPLRAHTLPTTLLRLTAHHRDLLIEARWRLTQRQDSLPGEAFDELIDALEQLILDAQDNSPVGAAFLRLGSRAPLDSPVAHGMDHQVDGGPEALEVLLQSNRVFEDLCLAQECQYEPTLILRPWLEIPRDAEVRAEWRDGALVDVGQRYPGVESVTSLEADRVAACAALSDALRRAFPTQSLELHLVTPPDADAPLLVDAWPIVD